MNLVSQSAFDLVYFLDKLVCHFDRILFRYFFVAELANYLPAVFDCTNKLLLNLVKCFQLAFSVKR